MTAVVALLLAGVKAHPAPTQMYDPSAGVSAVAPWALAANEVVFLGIALALVGVIGKRAGVPFALGFFAFAATHWIILHGVSGGGSSFSPPNLLHAALIEQQIRAVLGSVPQDKAWTISELRVLLYAIETLLAGVLGGCYSLWRVRVQARRST